MQAYPIPTNSPAFAAAAGLGITPVTPAPSASAPPLASALPSASAPVADRDWNRALQVAYENIVLNEVLPASAATQRMPSQDQAFERIGAAVRLNLEQLKVNI